MSNYIIKKVSVKKAKVNYPNPKGYEFAPKNERYAQVEKIVVVDESLKGQILNKKIANEYRKIVAYIYSILNENGENSANSLMAYTELERLKKILLYKYEKLIDKKILEMYLKKLDILAMEIHKLMISLYQKEEIMENKNKGVRR